MQEDTKPQPLNMEFSHETSEVEVVQRTCIHPVTINLNRMFQCLQQLQF